MVVHSITKYLAGHSDCLGGVVIGNKQLVDRLSQNEYMLFGGIMTPQSAALVIRGLRTLPLRMQRHEESGLILAKYLQNQSYVTQVNHPGLISHPQHELALRQMLGFSSLFSFESNEPVHKLREWANRLQYFKIGVSWGGFAKPNNREGDRREPIKKSAYIGPYLYRHGKSRRFDSRFG